MGILLIKNYKSVSIEMREEKKREPGVHLTLISRLQYQTSNWLVWWEFPVFLWPFPNSLWMSNFCVFSSLKRQVELANVHSAWVIANIQQPHLVATYFAGTVSLDCKNSCTLLDPPLFFSLCHPSSPFFSLYYFVSLSCRNCIMEWCNEKPECPLCRNPITHSSLVCLYHSDF